MNYEKLGRLGLAFRWVQILLGVICIIFGGIGVIKDCQYNYELSQAQKYIVATDAFIQDLANTTSGSDAVVHRKIILGPGTIEQAFWNIVEPKIKDSEAYYEKLEILEHEILAYRRPVIIETVSFIIILSWTFLGFVYLLVTLWEGRVVLRSSSTYRVNGPTMVGLIEFADVFYGFCGLFYLIGSILLLISSLRYKVRSEDLAYPFNCPDGQVTMSGVQLCQNYGAKIFAGIMELAIAFLCAVLTIIFRILKGKPVPTFHFYGGTESSEEQEKMELRPTNGETEESENCHARGDGEGDAHGPRSKTSFPASVYSFGRPQTYV